MKQTKLCRPICALLCLLLLLPLFTGCAALLGGGETKQVLNAENTKVGTDTLSLDMGEYTLNGEAECEIKQVKAQELPGVDMQAYDFSIDTEEELLSVMKLTIPYDEKALGGLSPEGNIGAAYYNEDTKEWEPVSFVINDNGTITINTEHLSTYGCFVVNDENTRNAYAAYAIPSNILFSGSSVDADSVVTEAAQNGGNPGPLAIEAGLDILDTTINVSSAGVDTVSHLINTYSLNSGSLGIAGNSLLNNIGDKLGKVGTAVSVAQVAYGMYNIYNGDTDAIIPCYRDALKGSASYIGGKVGSKLFNLAFLGVLAIDYSINKFGEVAWQGREDMYRKAYSLYYEEDTVKRSARDWGKLFLNARETAASPDKYYLRVEGLIKRYADEFWKDEATVAIYQSEASGKGFTGGGGLTEALKAEISADFVNELSRGVVQEAFKLIAERDVRITERDLLKELNALKAELNRECVLELYDGSLNEDKTQSDVAGGKALVVLPQNITDAKEWSSELNDIGEGNISFTLLAYLMAGMPGELNIYESGAQEDDSPAVIPFTMNDYTVRVDVGGGSGEISGTYTITYGKPDGSFEGTEEAVVELDGSKMTIRFTEHYEGDEQAFNLVGTIDENNVFVGKGTGDTSDLFTSSLWDMFETELTFDISASPIQATGILGKGLEDNKLGVDMRVMITMVKKD